MPNNHSSLLVSRLFLFLGFVHSATVKQGTWLPLHTWSHSFGYVPVLRLPDHMAVQFYFQGNPIALCIIAVLIDLLTMMLKNFPLSWSSSILSFEDFVLFWFGLVFSFKLAVIPPPWPPDCWDYQHSPPYLACLFDRSHSKKGDTLCFWSRWISF